MEQAGNLQITVSVLISMAGILGAGLSAYIGVRVAQAEMKTKIGSHSEDIVELKSRINRLEQRYFKD